MLDAGCIDGGFRIPPPASRFARRVGLRIIISISTVRYWYCRSGTFFVRCHLSYQSRQNQEDSLDSATCTSTWYEYSKLCVLSHCIIVLYCTRTVQYQVPGTMPSTAIISCRKDAPGTRGPWDAPYGKWQSAVQCYCLKPKQTITMNNILRSQFHILSTIGNRQTRIRLFTSSSLASDPYRIAIVGSGPAGCYTAKYLNSALESSQVDVFDRLPTPYGLVRNGVAPDHPQVKNVEHDFDVLFEENDDNLNFYGNVTVGTDISLEELREIYDVVVLAYGCESDKPFDFLENSKLDGILTAREFVSWYNGHVDFEWVGPVVDRALQNNSDGTQNVVIIGHGNVALDCARILAKTREELDPTDIVSRAMDIIGQGDGHSKRDVSVIGRRGHVQGAFTIKELRELTRLDHANFVVRADELDMGRTEASEQEIKDSRPRQRIDKLLTDAAVSSADIGAPKQAHLNLRFLLNPVRFETEDGSSLSHVTCRRTRLVGNAGMQAAEGTGEIETIKAQLVRNCALEVIAEIHFRCFLTIDFRHLSVLVTRVSPFLEPRSGLMRSVEFLRIRMD